LLREARSRDAFPVDAAAGLAGRLFSFVEAN
jgi:hypothetical protein